MGIGAILLALVVVGIVFSYITRDKLKRRALEWLTTDPVKGEIIYTLSESTTVAFEEVRKKLQKKYPHFELVKIKISAGNERMVLDHNSMSQEELRRSGELGHGIYGRLFLFTVSFKTANDMGEETLKCRVESNKPGVWKAAFVEFSGVNGQSGHPHKVGEMAVAAPQTPLIEKAPALELSDIPTIEDIAKETGALPLIAASEESAQPPASPTTRKPRPARRQRSANAIGAMSEV